MQCFLGLLSIPRRLLSAEDCLGKIISVLGVQQTKPCACQLNVGPRPCGPQRLSSLPSILVPLRFDCSLLKFRCSRQSCSFRAPQSTLRPKAQLVLSNDRASIIDNPGNICTGETGKNMIFSTSVDAREGIGRLLLSLKYV